MANNIISEKKRALIARKEKLLQEIQYYDKRIADFHANKKSTSLFEDDCSSDSDMDLPTIDCGPSVAHLKVQHSHLKTSLQATQELTNLTVLQSEVNVMVNDPVIIDEPQVQGAGVWREVIAECQLDRVLFTISFNVHTPSSKFGGLSYRNLKVTMVKAAQQVELAKSVLAHTTTPSDAVEVLRSYSVAHRSRRTSLARLAEKYPNLLHMEPLSEGGYILKCAGLLEVCWTLQNKWSPISPFHHRMRFDLEYMDESYIKIITQYHRQLSDPSIETDERTALLSKIINTCLEAKGPTQELYESMESDPETAQNLRQRRTTLDQEVTETAPKKKRDNDIMAPPKSLPKKSKAKGKENVEKVAKGKENVDKAAKGKENVDKTAKSEENTDKAIKTNTNNNESNAISKSKQSVGKQSVKSTQNFDKNVTNASGKESVASSKSKDVRKESIKTVNEGSDQRKESVTKSAKKAESVSKSADNVAKSTKEGNNKNDVLDKNVTSASNKESIASAKSKTDNKKDITKSTNACYASEGSKNSQVKENKDNLKDHNERNTNMEGGDNDKVSNVATVLKKSTTDKKNDELRNPDKMTKKAIVSKVTDNKEINTDKAKKDKVITDNNKKISSNKGSATNTKVNPNVKKNDEASLKNYTDESVPKKVKKTDDIANIPAKKAKIDNTDKNAPNTNIAKPKKSSGNINKPEVLKKLQKTTNVKTTESTNAKPKDNLAKKDSTFTKSTEIKKVIDKNKVVSTKEHLADKDMTEKNKNIEKAKVTNILNKAKAVKSDIENNKNINNEKLNQKLRVSGHNKFNNIKKLSPANMVKGAESKVTKIPQKSTTVPTFLKKNPLRVSPRKLSKNTKSAPVVKTIQKPVTSIPRLLKKPVVKT